MFDSRMFLKENDILTLGNLTYTIKKVVGAGNSSVAYEAIYQDELNTDISHKVLIKELYPFHPNGGIFRSENGDIICNSEAYDYFEFCKTHFKKGNEINLKLLQEFPSEISGNINSFETKGTYYSVLTSYGGKNLFDIINENGIVSLKDAIEVTLLLVEALSCFHKNGMLHLDISPDNILIQRNCVMLIDYNSSWLINEENLFDLAISEKPGFSAPEVRLRNLKEIGYSTDLYSVCAVLFRLITGEVISDECLNVSWLKKTLNNDLPLLKNEQKSTVFKLIQILVKGLHVLPRKRFCSYVDLKAELEEILLRIEGKGVSASALWELSCGQRKNACIDKNSYLKQNIKSSTLTDISELITELIAGKCYLLTGVGGIGKTRLLYEIWKRCTNVFSENAPIVLYIPLKVYQEYGGEGRFIHKYFSGFLSFSATKNSVEDIMHELDKLFCNEQHKIILLLDGLNEAGKHTEGLLKEIEKISSNKNVGILLTDRTTDVKSYGLGDFESISLELLEADVVREELKSLKIEEPDDEKMLDLLRNPMLLSLYVNASLMNEENGGVGELSFASVDEMIWCYIEQTVIHQQRVYNGEISQQVRSKFILTHLLPEIANRMKRKASNILNHEELFDVVKENYESLKNRSFGKAFPEYMGKTRYILQDISNESEWFDFSIREYLVDEIGILVKFSGENYSLIHDNFIDCLSKKAEPMVRFKKKIKSRKKLKIAGLAFCLIALFTAASFLITSFWGLNSSDSAYSEKEIVPDHIKLIELISEYVLPFDEALSVCIEGTVALDNYVVFGCERKEIIETLSEVLTRIEELSQDGMKLDLSTEDHDLLIKYGITVEEIKGLDVNNLVENGGFSLKNIIDLLKEVDSNNSDSLNDAAINNAFARLAKDLMHILSDSYKDAFYRKINLTFINLSDEEVEDLKEILLSKLKVSAPDSFQWENSKEDIMEWINNHYSEETLERQTVWIAEQYSEILSISGELEE